MIWQKLVIFIFIFGWFLPLSQVSAATVLSSHKYAWSDNVGYINFENVVVSESALSGYAWSANYGWIKFDPAQGGVVNNGNGDLSGSAWGESLGWIDFNGVSIDSSTGQFAGTATGEVVGTINFDCPNYCDVRTNWRKAVSSGAASVALLTTTPNSPRVDDPNTVPVNLPTKADDVVPVKVLNAPLIIAPTQSGTLTKDVPAGKVTIEVPAGSVLSQATFTVLDEVISPANRALISAGKDLVNGIFYDISAKDQDGNYIHTFKKNITISFPVPGNLQKGLNLGVYWFNVTNGAWVLIPDAVFANNKVTFQVNHLTRFAIFALPSEGKKLPSLSITPITSAKSSSTVAKALFDVTSESLTKKIAPGEALPISVKLANFGSEKRVDVLIEYSIISSTGEEVYSAKETVAVETTANFIKTAQIPLGIAPGIYTAKTSITYSGQVVPATTQFSFRVESKLAGVFQGQFYLFGLVVLSVLIFIAFVMKKKL